ncbi:MAG TPA: hypothetical protein VEA38_05255 [Terriglobales bacterium]|nr:hypothetical protein [Terriglobales bacterium]
MIQKLDQIRAAQANREALAKAAGISNPDVVEKLLQLGVQAETVAALALVPLVEVAWADGELDRKERAAILERARESGLAAGSVEYALLDAWLDRRPDPKLLAAWTHLVRGVSEELGREESARLKADLLDRARAVATASGGVLGIGSKVSSAEAAILRQLEGAFPA